jgi:hypothetical protein
MGIERVRAVLSLAVAILAFASPMAWAQPRTELIRSLDGNSLSQLLQVAGFAPRREQEGGFIVSRENGGPELWVRLMHCDGQGVCSYLRIRGVWLIGDRQSARAAVEGYDRTVPIAFVAVIGEGDQTTAHAGRDVWLTPGRTTANLVAELQFSSDMAVAMTQALEAADPEIRAFWEARDAH